MRGGDPSYGITAFGYAARFDQAGVVRQDDYESGRMGFYDTYDPNQGGESNRLLFTLHTASGAEEARFHQAMFLGHRTMRMRANFTGWMTDTLATSGEVPGVSEQRGDGAESRYGVLTAGSRGHYTLSKQMLGHEQRLTMGYAIRFDQGSSSQRRIRAVTAIPYTIVFDRNFTVVNLSGWTRLHARPLRNFALRGGVRFDAFSFGVTDLNQDDVDREGPRLPDQTSQSFGYAINPRATADITLAKGLHFLTSYGQGTRSTEAAALSDNETAPFALAHVMDSGFSYKLGKEGDPIAISSQASYSYAHVDKDILFSEAESRNVLVGSSTRHAVLMGTRMTVGSWLDTVLNAGWAHATLDDTGELIPIFLSGSFVWTRPSAARFRIGRLAGFPWSAIWAWDLPTSLADPSRSKSSAIRCTSRTLEVSCGSGTFLWGWRREISSTFSIDSPSSTSRATSLAPRRLRPVWPNGTSLLESPSSSWGP